MRWIVLPKQPVVVFFIRGLAGCNWSILETARRGANPSGRYIRRNLNTLYVDVAEITKEIDEMSTMNLTLYNFRQRTLLGLVGSSVLVSVLFLK